MKFSRILTLVLSQLLAAAGALRAVDIADAEHEGRAQFKIVTASATWFYDKAGGGFSRLLDIDGRDWIGFRKNPLSVFPASAAAGYRGMPNTLYGKSNPDAGAGHPGFDQCESVQSASDTIHSATKSGRWAWSWRFTETHAVLTIEKADSTETWWFLYEGTIAGRFAPRQHYWGTDLGGPRRDTPDHRAKQHISGRWHWAYFGDETVPRVLFIAQLQPDTLDDYFSYLGNDSAGINSSDGMVVFGFGRGANPLMRGAGAQFTVGFLEHSALDSGGHRRLAESIAGVLKAH